MLRGVKTVFCSDILLDAVTKCRKNLKWTSKKYKTISTVIVKKADIRNFPFDGIQSWATEPDLGPALKEKPSKRDAEKILRFLKKNYDFLFKQLYEKSQKNARIAVIFPCINAKGKKIFMDKHYHGFEIVDLFKKIPKKFKDELKINRSNFILDEEREKGRSRTTIREFGVFRTLKK